MSLLKCCDPASSLHSYFNLPLGLLSGMEDAWFVHETASVTQKMGSPTSHVVHLHGLITGFSNLVGFFFSFKNMDKCKVRVITPFFYMVYESGNVFYNFA